jgi:type IV pilus assembly protein PilM
VIKRKSLFGLDVGSSIVKAVQLRRTRRGVELEKFAAVPIFPNGRPEADSDLRQAKITAIQRAVGAAKISTKHVISSVSGEAIIVRYIQLPQMTEAELKNALRYEAEEYIPFHIDEVNLDSHILGLSEDSGGKRINVLLVAAKRDVIREHIDVIRGAGLLPKIVDVDSFALFNCFDHVQNASPQDVIVLVDIGAEVTNINIFHGGLSHFARDIAIGGQTITNALMQKLGIEQAEAEQIKYTEGVPHHPEAASAGNGEDDAESPLINSIQGAVSEMTSDDLGDDSLESQASRVIKNALNTLLTEIRRSLQFFENQVSGRAVTRMVLSGGTAKLPNLPQHFSHELGIPVDVLDPIQGMVVNSRSVDERALANCREMLGVGIGLALREVA